MPTFRSRKSKEKMMGFSPEIFRITDFRMIRLMDKVEEFRMIIKVFMIRQKVNDKSNKITKY